ncbi:MAG: transcriptional regulator, MarR family [Micrococcaceae bacterium]|jgi:DNA-binding MarR family transcriptional regulator|nr:transcriptional regulator, MarR family [Micrococcaceae bacterium]
MGADELGASGYWYGPEAAGTTAARAAGAAGAGATSGAAVLRALRQYRSCEQAIRRSTRDAMGMGETDLLAVRHLLRAQRLGLAVGPKELSRMLGITTASTTSLIDRLVSSGHARREPHPTDRRSLVIVPTRESDTEVRRTLGGMHRRMMEVAEHLTPAQAEVVIRFLGEMGAAITEGKEDSGSRNT